MLEEFRKTLAYKICGCLFFIIFILTIIIAIPKIIMSIAFWWLPGMWNWVDDYAKYYLIINFIVFVFLNSIALLTALLRKTSTSESNSIADIGYILMLIITAIALLKIPSDYITEQKHINKEKERMYNETIVLKESCKLITQNFPKFLKELGPDFTENQFIGKLSKIELIYDTYYEHREDGEFSIINFKYNLPNIPVVYQYVTLHKSNNKEPCSINKDNCYISVYLNYELEEQGNECIIFYDKNNIFPTKATLHFINN